MTFRPCSNERIVLKLHNRPTQQTERKIVFSITEGPNENLQKPGYLL